MSRKMEVETDGSMYLYLEESVPVIDISTWSADRIAAFWDGVARVVAAVSGKEPASEPAKVECPNCLQEVPGELEHWHSGYHDDNYTVEPHYICEQQISEIDDRHMRMASPDVQAKYRAAIQRRISSEPDVVIGAVGGAAKPVQPEPVKVECPNCRELGDHMIPATAGHFLGPQYLCQFMPKPAQPKPVAHEDAEFMRAGALAMARIIERDEKPEPVAEEMPEAVREPAPPNSLPNYGECALRVANSNFLAKRKAEGGYGPEHSDTPQASALHRFIYEYDDADPYRSAWFLHRLELVVNAVRSQPAKVRMTPELETILAQTLATANHFLTMPGTVADVGRDLLRDIAAVRTQAAEAADASAVYDKGFADGIALQKKCGAEAGKVTLPQVRIALNTMKTHFEPNCQGQCEFPMVWNICRFGIEELDSHEGKGEGRG